LLGGIPLTSVIVRSSVNIDVGAKTKISTILHGFFLLVLVLFAVPLLNLIPLSSLAAILIFTGYKLAKLSIFKEMLKKGWNQFIPFVATIFSIVFTDLLIGIIIGLVVSIFFLLKSNLNYPSIMKKDVKYKEEIYNLTLSNQVSFLNKSGIKKALWNIPKGSMITIDAVNCDFIDNDVLEIIDEFKTTVSKEKKIQLNILGLKEKYQLDDQIDFIDYLDKDTLNTLSPEDILQILQDGNDRFVSGKGRRKDYTKQVEAGSTGQNPMAVFVSCIDSRTSPEIIFDLGLGDILSIRIAGNIINEDILGNIELACQKLGAKLVVVLGHSECGAIATAINKFDEGFIGSVMQKIEKAVDQCGCDRLLLLENNEAFNNVVKQNTLNSYHDIVSQSEYLKNAKENGKIDIVSGYYDLKTGIVSFEKHQS
jgi:carbonic anhydrase